MTLANMTLANMTLANSTPNATTPVVVLLTVLKPFTKVEPFRPSETFVSNEFRAGSEIIVDLCLSFVIANVGIVSNIIVIVVFAKQGYKESMNISMTAIAIWDLIKCLAGSLQRMAGPISLVSEAKAESWENISTVSMTYLITFVSYVSSVLAAYVAVERCLCVSMPLLVKTLLTPRVTFLAMTSLSIIVFGSFAVIFSIFNIIWVHSPQWNETIAVYRYSAFFYQHEGPMMKYYNLAGIIWPTVSFFVIIFCTSVIVYQLHKASKFRSKSQQSSESYTISDRDKHVVKMLVVIIAIYVISIFPRIALYMAKYFVYELYFLRTYHNIFLVICYFIILFDLSNATINLFVFLTMSSNFKATAKELLPCGETKQVLKK